MGMFNLLMWLAIGGIVCVPAALTIGGLALERVGPCDRAWKAENGAIAVLFILP